jgi:hypothetical protein
MVVEDLQILVPSPGEYSLSLSRNSATNTIALSIFATFRPGKTLLFAKFDRSNSGGESFNPLHLAHEQHSAASSAYCSLSLHPQYDLLHHDLSPAELIAASR